MVTSVQISLTSRYVHKQPMHIQKLSDDKWVVCHTGAGGKVMVLNSGTLALLNCFQEPSTLPQVAQLVSHWPYEALNKAVHLFLQTNLIEDTELPRKSNLFQKSDSLDVWFHVTNACNLRCSYCYINKSSEHMDAEIARRSIDAVFRSARLQGYRRVYLKYAGGEPTLQPDGLFAIHEYATSVANQYNIELSGGILSNGVALTKRVIDGIKAHHLLLSISLDGVGLDNDAQRAFANGAGSFRFVDRTLRRLKENQLRPYMLVVVSRKNLQGLPKLINYLVDMELPFHLSFYRENVETANLTDLRFEEQQMIEAVRAAFQIVEENLSSYPYSILDCLDMTHPSRPGNLTCGVSDHYMVIDNHGGIAKCQVDIKNSVTTIDHANPLQVIRSDRSGVWGAPVEEKEGCKACEWRYWCTGGCPKLALTVTGRCDVKSPNCGIYMALLPELLRLEALRLLEHHRPSL